MGSFDYPGMKREWATRRPGAAVAVRDMKNKFIPPVRVITHFDNISTEELLELAVGRINRMDALALAMFSRLIDQEAELKTLKSRLAASGGDPEVAAGGGRP